jgi:hypothetical protein
MHAGRQVLAQALLESFFFFFGFTFFGEDSEIAKFPPQRLAERDQQ